MAVTINGTTGISTPAITGMTTALTVAQGGTGAATLTGIVKGSGTSAFTAATAGTDYLAPPSGTSILKANSGGALSNATAGTDYCAATSGSSVLKGSSGNTTAATAGTDYVAPGTATTFTALQTFNGATGSLASKFLNALEGVTISGTGLATTLNFDVTTQSVYYSTASATANWTINFRGNGTTTLNSLMAIGESVTVAVLTAQGATAYYASAMQVDGTAVGVTTKAQGSSAPSSGHTSSTDVYTYTIIKTANATFTIFYAQTQFV